MTVEPTVASLRGRVALVTGAGQGIGEAIAVSYAAWGADVAVCDRDTESLASTVAAIEARGQRAVSGVLDVRNVEAATAFVNAVGAACGQIDIVVNNAGGGFHAPFLDISSKGQSALVDENFSSVTTFVRACVPWMPRGGSIINLTSVEAFRAAPGFSIYAAMKAAVEQLSRTLALELAPLGIRVNCIAPDAIPTPGDAGLADAVHAGGDPTAYGAHVPLGLGSPDDAAAVAVFLASDLARFVTGTTLHVDGGTDAARGWRRRADGGWEP